MLSFIQRLFRKPSSKEERLDQCIYHHNRGVDFQESGRFREATREYTLALELNPNWVPSYVNLATICNKHGDHSPALKLLETAYSISPNEYEVLMALGDALFGVDQYAEALRHYREAINARPNSPMAHLKMGTVLVTLKQFDQGIASINHAIKIAPEWADGYFGLCLAYLQTGNEIKALNALRMTLNVDPNHAGANEMTNKMEANIANHLNVELNKIMMKYPDIEWYKPDTNGVAKITSLLNFITANQLLTPEEAFIQWRSGR